DKRRAGQSRNHAAAQRVKTASHAAKVCLEGIKQRERLDGIDVVVIAAESNRVAAMRPGDVIHYFKASLFIKIGIATIPDTGEDVARLQVWLGGIGGEIEITVVILHMQLVHQRRLERRIQ